MSFTRTRPGERQWLDPAARELLAARLEAAVRRARTAGEALAAVTVAAPAVDPSALVVASRRPGEPWFSFEQPDRDGAALAALGCVREIEVPRGPAFAGHVAGSGTPGSPGRFQAVAREWRALAAAAIADPPDGPSGAGLVAVGGFAFAPDGAGAPQWEGFTPASLHVPELAVARRGGDVRLTVAALATPDVTADDLLERVDARLAELRAGVPLPLLDPAPTGRYRVVSAMPPEHYEGAVARAVERIRAGALEKVVLAREVQVHAPRDHEPGAILGALRDGFPECYVYAVGRGEATFVGATPELLVRRDGERASTVALAGSTRRSADPSVDDHLG